MSQLIATKQINDYYDAMLREADHAYAVATSARERGFDPDTKVETPRALDVAARVEALVGPEGIADKLRDLLKSYGREETAAQIIKYLVDTYKGKWGVQKTAAQCIRTALALLTEGVVAAPIEGISEVKVERNPDGSHYLMVHFAGPIRSAGGTAQAQAVLVADYTRELLDLSNYRPLDTEVERYVEEIGMYHNLVARLQYFPSEADIRVIVRNCPVCISGDPTAEIEVAVYKNIPRIPTNRIRGGMCLVIAEGIAQKAAKMIKHAKLFGMNWDWLLELSKASSESSKERDKATEFLKDIVAGRPVFAYPSMKGGFRLRYGRCRNSGIMAKCIHPATMAALDSFPAIGTQFKIERPGKGAAITPCTTIDGPVVKLKDGSVIKLDSFEQAKDLQNQIYEILFVGDLLVCYGDFLRSNRPLLPAGYCEEWWIKELEKAGGKCINPFNVTVEEAIDYSRTYNIPLHPRYTFPYHDLSPEQLIELIKWMSSGALKNKFASSPFQAEPSRTHTLANGPNKRILEELLVPHKINEENDISIEAGYDKALMLTLDIPNSLSKLDSLKGKASMEVVRSLSPFTIRDKAPTYIGARMGRPEKAKERLMKPAPHILFPLGYHGTQLRLFEKAREKKVISVSLANSICPKCGKHSLLMTCPDCNARVELKRVCQRCGRESNSDVCQSCGSATVNYVEKTIKLDQALELASRRVGVSAPAHMKGVKGTISASRSFEPLEKGILRALHDVFVFKDGTIRFDATNLPLTHFKPDEVQTTIERLRELGYTHDCHGEQLTRPDQILELKPQDIVVSQDGIDYLIGVTKFIDDLLEKFYGLERYYNCSNSDDLIGQLVIGLAPHTSAGILGRIIGFTKARGCYAHPYFHQATRRDCFSPEETLPIFDGKLWQIVKIGEFIDGLVKSNRYRTTDFGDIVVETNGYKTLSLNANGNYTPKRITAFSKHPVQDHVVELKLKNGRTITTSPMHPFIDARNHNKSPASSLTHAIVPKLLNIPERDIAEIDLLDYLNDDYVMVVGMSGALKRYLDAHGLMQTATKLGVKKTTLFNYTTRNSVPVSMLRRLGITIPEKTELKARWDTVLVPRVIKLTPDMLRLIGFYIAEGHTRMRSKLHYQTSFAVMSRKRQLFIGSLIRKAMGVTPNYGDHSVTISSRLIYDLFTNILKCGKGAKSKRIPQFVLSLPLQKARYVLQGYFEGDGSITGNPTLEVNCTSASKLLLKDIEFILQRFGIYCSWYEDNRTMSTGTVANFYIKRNKVLKWTCYKLRLYGDRARAFCKQIGFWSRRKNSKAVRLMHTAPAGKPRFRSSGNEIIATVKSRKILKNKLPLYNLTVADTHNVVMSGISSFQCDGDENSIMLLMDVLLNFSKSYLPESRGGKMDAPLVLTLALDPAQVDDQVHEMDISNDYPLELYEKSLKRVHPKEIKVELVANRLGKENQYDGMGFTHDTEHIAHGVTNSNYTVLKTMTEKVYAQLALGKMLRPVDVEDEAVRLLNTHFLRDLYGNLRAFGEQQLRCTGCNTKYRRVPLVGKCTRCGGNLVLTIAEGSVRKYLEIAKEVARTYHSPEYIQQRLNLLESDINSVFTSDKARQYSLSDFI